MIFTSYEYLLFFLPLMVFGYYFFTAKSRSAGISWIILGSFFFYATWDPIYLLLLGGSIAVNYVIGLWIRQSNQLKANSKFKLALGISFNIILLSYYKYTNFTINLVNDIIGTTYHLEHIVLPLAISFFTFQQIAWLMDQYRGDIVSCSFSEYVCAVVFFPHLIAGPIVRYAHLVPQFQDNSLRKIHWENIAKGFFFICCGAFKKIVIADSLSQYVSYGFDSDMVFTFIPAWELALSYCFQIYFDFSGYCDVAIGSALLMNFNLPENFHSPYKAKNIQEFWRTWHITLGDFLTRYLYIPLGGSQKGLRRTCINVFLVMAISGIWHGAGYGFILWGILHGSAMVIHRLWKHYNMKMHYTLGWLITFTFVTLTWVFFRALDLDSAFRIYRGLFGLNGITLPEVFETYLPAFLPFQYVNSEALFSTGTSGVFMPIVLLLTSFILVLLGREINTLWNKVNWEHKSTPVLLALASGVLLFITFSKMIIVPHTEFIYFNF